LQNPKKYPAFLRLNCDCGKATYIHAGDKVECSRCHKAVRFLWGNSGHTFMGMKEEKRLLENGQT
jgi:ribosomal protein S27E